MIGRITLREVREALAAAQTRGANVSAPSPTIQELESLARLLERELEAAARAEVSPNEGGVEQSYGLPSEGTDDARGR